MVESTGASARYHAQDGHHPGEAIFCGLLAGVACVPCISKTGVQDDVKGLAKTYLNAWKSGKVCCFHVNCFPKRLLFTSEGLSHHYQIQHSQDRVSGDEEIKRRKNVLRKLMASGTSNKIAIQS